MKSFSGNVNITWASFPLTSQLANFPWHSHWPVRGWNGIGNHPYTHTHTHTHTLKRVRGVELPFAVAFYRPFPFHLGPIRGTCNVLSFANKTRMKRAINFYRWPIELCFATPDIGVVSPTPLSLDLNSFF